MSRSVIRRVAIAVVAAGALAATFAPAVALAQRPRGRSADSGVAPATSRVTWPDSTSWRHLGPAAFGGRIDDIEAVAERPAHHLRRRRVRRRVSQRQQRRHVGAGARPLREHALRRRHRDCAERPERRLGRDGRAEQPTELHLGRRRVSFARRRHDVAAHGASRDADDRAHRDRSRATRTPCSSPRSGTSGGLTSSAASIGRRTAARRGRRCSASTSTPAPSTSPSTATAARCSPRRISDDVARSDSPGSGPGSGLWRSLDGGDTWERLTSANGLPTGDVGTNRHRDRRERARCRLRGDREPERRRVSLERSRPRRGRARARRTSAPSYYSQIRVDPNDANRVWLLATSIFSSVDGGKTFVVDSASQTHVHPDHHALWIDPHDSRHMLLGNDGGVLRHVRPRAALAVHRQPADLASSTTSRSTSAIRTGSTAARRTTGSGRCRVARSRAAG